MSGDSMTRRTAVDVSFDGVDMTGSIRPYLLSLTYTDNEEGETDDLQLKLQDREGVWAETWLDQAVAAAVGAAFGNSPREGGGAAAGSTAQLADVPFYYTSTAESPSVIKSGTFYFYDGVCVNGRYRMTNSAERCGRLPVGENVTGWVDASDCVPESGSPDAAEGSGGRSGGAAGSGKLKISAVITPEGWGDGAVLPTGDFELDSVKADGPPATVVIKGTSLPFSAAIRQTKKSRAWENYKLSGIAGEIAAVNGLRCMFESDNDPFYERVEQRKTSDSTFLAKLCRDAGISLKSSHGQLILFDQLKYEAQAPVLTVRKGTASEKGLYTKYSLSVGAAEEQYGSCRVSYLDPGSGKCVEGTYSADEEDTAQCLEISAKVSDAAEARALAEKFLRLHNKFTRFVSFTFPGDPTLAASSTIQLEGWGSWDGKYIIKRAVHTVSAAKGYTTQITGRRCLAGY